MNAPCASNPDLFDSTDLFEARQARTICGTCDLIDACKQMRRDLMDPLHEGTWAGVTYGGMTAIRRKQRELERAEGAA